MDTTGQEYDKTDYRVLECIKKLKDMVREIVEEKEIWDRENFKDFVRVLYALRPEALAVIRSECIDDGPWSVAIDEVISEK